MFKTTTLIKRFIHRPFKSWKSLGCVFPASWTSSKGNIWFHPSVMVISYDHSKKGHYNSKIFNRKILTWGALAISSVIYYTFKQKVAFAEKNEVTGAGQFIENLPLIKESEISKHRTKEERIWVTYKSGVYDVTEFVDQHPGGNKILLAAGSTIEPFWSLYAVHHSPEIYTILEQYRIGNLEIDKTKVKKDEQFLDPYSKDPERHPVLKPASVKPFNAEPPPSLLVDNFYTPNSIFYVRNHLPVPEVDVKTYKLEVKGIGVKEKFLTLDDIKKFPKYTVSASVQCAGNRRTEMSKIKTVKGLSWGHAAIGNATWSGARLTDVLKSSGLNLDDARIEHVHFEGLDKGPENVPYGASVPAEKALDPKGDVLLAYEMNGEPLPRDHGFPLRVIVPGIVGARNVKWVSKIILSDKESGSHWQQNDYKGFSPSTDWDTVDFKSAPAIQELPVISAICTPEEGEKVELIDGTILVKGEFKENEVKLYFWLLRRVEYLVRKEKLYCPLPRTRRFVHFFSHEHLGWIVDHLSKKVNKTSSKGYAWSGGGKRIVRVDVSSDKGKTWHVADLEQVDDKSPRHWAWTIWTVNIPVTENEERVEIWAKAVDSSYNTQPENFENIWNLRGVLGNAYHKVGVHITES